MPIYLVKLQKRFAYRYKSKEGTKTHYKYVITIPEEFIEALGWSHGDEIDLTLNTARKILALTRIAKTD